MLLEPDHHVMSPEEAYVDSYGLAVNDLTNLWTHKCIFRVDGLSDTPLQFPGPPVHFTLNK
jgi:hypothetical protein